ncbi:MAG: asparaginase [Thermoprotei archaeon]|nr:MAG: asparaginase [Thermoprotei archaeon]RLE89781.1 MAG: asparaginase [Thermoprotei archaeon]
MSRHVIVVHGGAGGFSKRDEKYLEILSEATAKGFNIIERGGSALDAVVEAVVVLENSGKFNAGLGSCLTLDGIVEMDAGVMDGSTGRVGCVGAVRCVKNPIILARKVMELTDHILLVGEGAEMLAKCLGLNIDPSLLLTEEKLSRLSDIKEKIRKQGSLRLKKLDKIREVCPDLYGTVGAVALDRAGNLATATSTGGYWLKLRGRVGDTPIIGAGIYADKTSAASATGMGEVIMKTLLCFRVCQFIEWGVSPQKAAEAGISIATKRYGSGNAGVIVVDRNGDIGIAFNTRGMAIAYMYEGMDRPIAEIRIREDI